jgi:DNA-binding transcriptional ArsR family regulator
VTQEFEQIASLERIVHEPARLVILTALAACRQADFIFLQSLTGFTKGNLSAHLIKLEQAGLVSIEKRFRGKFPQTFVTITKTGRTAIRQHWQSLDALRRTLAKTRSPKLFGTTTT